MHCFNLPAAKNANVMAGALVAILATLSTLENKVRVEEQRDESPWYLCVTGTPALDCLPLNFCVFV